MNLPCFFGRWLSLLQGNASVGKGYLWGCMQEQILQEVTDSQVMFHCIFKLELAPSCIAFVGLHKFVGLRMLACICNLAACTSLRLVAFVNMHPRLHAVELNELNVMHAHYLLLLSNAGGHVWLFQHFEPESPLIEIRATFFRACNRMALGDSYATTFAVPNVCFVGPSDLFCIPVRDQKV